MPPNPAFGNPIAFHQKPDKLYQRLHLPGRWPALIEITNEAYPDGIFIGPVARRFAVCSGKLALPAECNFDLAITAVSSVAYNKVVAYALPVPAFSVPPVKYSCIAVIGSRMVYYDSRPPSLEISRRQPGAGEIRS